MRHLVVAKHAVGGSADGRFLDHANGLGHRFRTQYCTGAVQWAEPKARTAKHGNTAMSDAPKRVQFR